MLCSKAFKRALLDIANRYLPMIVTDVLIKDYQYMKYDFAGHVGTIFTMDLWLYVGGGYYFKIYYDLGCDDKDSDITKDVILISPHHHHSRYHHHHSRYHHHSHPHNHYLYHYHAYDGDYMADVYEDNDNEDNGNDDDDDGNDDDGNEAGNEDVRPRSCDLRDHKIVITDKLLLLHDFPRSKWNQMFDELETLFVRKSQPTLRFKRN
jgi:hypothetical protein